MKLRTALALITLVAAQPVAAASLYEEMSAQRARIVGTGNLVPSQQIWRQANHDKLMAIIEGRWIQSSELKLANEEQFNVACAEQGLLFKKLTDYSFDAYIPNNINTSGKEIHVEYIFKDGLTYNLRNNIEQQFEVFGRDQPNGPKVLRDANGVSMLMSVSPDTLLEVSYETGTPVLWSRCPT